VATLQSAASSLTPVSVFQVLAAAGPAAEGDPLVIGGCPVYLVSLVCRVSMDDDASDGSTATCTLQDHTGWVRAIHTPLTLSSTAEPPTTVAERDGYHLVVGKPKGAKRERHIDIDTLRPIASYDELTLHLLGVLSTDLERSRGPLEAQRHAPDVSEGVLVSGRAVTTQQRVLTVCQGAPETGMYTHEIVDALREHANAEEIRAALQWLSREGLIFTTISDDQWKSEGC